jgi:hypothetical protein
VGRWNEAAEPVPCCTARIPLFDDARLDRERTRIADQRTRVEDAIEHLESSSTISKLVGVSVLSGYLDMANKETHRRILLALAGLMATEKDSQTQAAVIDLIAGLTARRSPVEAGT